MKICIVGPGIQQIPPIGWGAVEILIWDYKIFLEKLGYNVHIINTSDRYQIIKECNELSPDLIHIHYDVFWDICKYLECENIILTSHYGYIDQESKYDYDYINILKGILSLNNIRIFALSKSNADKFVKFGFDRNKVDVMCNGVRDDLFDFKEKCERPNDSIYLAKIEPRKRQYLFHNIDNLYFVGNQSDSKFSSKNYISSWSKEILYKNLTHFSNLVLLSDGEAHPLVCMEAMASGLGLVISEYCTANLDLSLPFIDVIPESRINDLEFISEVIKENKEKSITMRNEIRKYAIDNFSYDVIVDKYVQKINKIYE